MLTLRFEGVQAIEKRLAQLTPELRRQVAGEMFRQAEDVMADSKENHVPVDFGVLKNSGHVQLPTIEGDRIIVELGYGGPAAPYAVIQHERMDLRHTVGGPKYLERPLLAAAARIRNAIATAVRKALG